ncbi:MAG: hypothetical protein ISS46_02125 [Candidatus Omnitrophica bacterium]|nr:hypothetical protein [Candidatus Omnitrophota bacterium]
MKSGKIHLTVILLVIAIILAFVIYTRMMTLIATKFIGDFLREELGEAMGKAVVIKRVSWSPLGKVALHDAKLTTLDKDTPLPIIEADKIETDFTVWDIFFKKFRRPLGKIVFIRPRLYFGARQQSFLAFYNPLAKKRGIPGLLLPKLYIQDGEIIVLEPERKAYFTLKSVSGFIDPTIPVRTRISLKGKPQGDEYTSFSFRGTLNLLTLAHDLKLNWQGLRLSSLKRFIGGMEFKGGVADMDLTLERRREYDNPWAGYSGNVKISDGVAALNNVVTPLRFEGIFELKEKDFFSREFLAYLGESKFRGAGRLFFFGEPELDINLRGEAVELEDLIKLSKLSTASGATGCGKLTLRAFGKMRDPEIEGEISFPEVRAFSTSLTDIYSSFSGHTGELNLKKLSVRLCDGYFTAHGNISEDISLRFNLKEAEIHNVCNMLAYSGVMVNPILRNYSSQLKGRVNLSGEAKGPRASPHITGFFTGRAIETENQSFQSAKARFEYSSSKGLKFTPLALGEEYCLWSEFCLTKERKLELSLQMNNANVESLIRDLDLKVPSLTGLVSGKIELYGDVEGIKSQGHLIIESGTISDIGFEKMDLVFRGVDREIDIENSSISQEKGKILLMRGKILLGDEGKSSMEIKPSDTGFVWEGWNIEKDPDQMEFSMGRNISKNWYLSFSTPVDNIRNFPEINKPPRPDTADKAELQYRLDDERRLKLYWRDKEEFIGLQQKFKF